MLSPLQHDAQTRTAKGKNRPWPKLLLALLVGNGAGSLASRLAGGLALAAATLGSALFKIGFVNSLYVFHFLFALSKMIILLKFKF